MKPVDSKRTCHMTIDEHTEESVGLEERAFSVKKRFLAMYKRANAGHVGSSLSCAEILVFVKFAWMRSQDELILSKGHAVGALYALLAEAGSLNPSRLDSFYDDGTRLPALPPFDGFEEIPFATGSLGYGLSLSAGMALAATFDRLDERFFCVTSDGELDEGSVWEAALFIAHRRLTNVVWIIDRNRIQAIGRTEDVLALEPLDAKLRAFGFHVLAVDGHDFPALLAAKTECDEVLRTGDQPVVIIANTVKGHGVSHMRNTVDSHYLPMSDAQYAEALVELTRDYETRLEALRHAR